MDTKRSADTRIRNVIKFIPCKTLTMDIEAILSECARLYFNRKNATMVELIALSEAELYPVGSFDPAAEKYEYILKLAIPVKFFNHLKSDIDHLRTQLLCDLSEITAPYIHEFISEVFLVITIEQDTSWRETILDYIENGHLDRHPAEAQTITLLYASADASDIAQQCSASFRAAGCTTALKSFDPSNERDFRHYLHECETANSHSVLIVSPAFIALPFSQETRRQCSLILTNPGKRFCQIWDGVSRVDVADFYAGMARSLAYTTERMTIEHITKYLLDLFAISRPEA